MSADQLLAAYRVRPFVPFRLNLSDGRSFPVPRPENLLVTTRTAVVGVYPVGPVDDRSFADHAETIHLIHIVSLEPLT